MFLATWWNLSKTSGDLKIKSKNMANLGHFFPWKILCICRNHTCFRQVEIWRKFASKRKTASCAWAMSVRSRVSDRDPWRTVYPPPQCRLWCVRSWMDDGLLRHGGGRDKWRDHRGSPRERERERNGSSLAWYSVGSSSVASTGNSLEHFGLAPSIPPGHRLFAGVEGRRVWWLLQLR
jgi:hypothetical protein